MAIVNYTESWIDTYNKYLGSINFTEGDFDGLKAVIRDYVTRQNPEGYNDWQQSSEVGMCVNAIAYLGENINYRVDLNVNDLFPETTQRKQSLLNFTRMLSYESKRNICAAIRINRGTPPHAFDSSSRAWHCGKIIGRIVRKVQNRAV